MASLATESPTVSTMQSTMASTTTITSLGIHIRQFLQQQQPPTISSIKSLQSIFQAITEPTQLLSSSQKDFDDLQWDFFSGLLACTENPDLKDSSLPIFTALCPLIPARELLLIANAALQQTNNMATRILVSFHIRDALNRTNRRKARLMDDYLSIVRRCIQKPLLETASTFSEDEDPIKTESVSHMPLTMEERASLAILHAEAILSNLNTTPGNKVKESQLKEETCGLCAVVVNFACLTLQDYATMSLEPLENGHGCRFPSIPSSPSTSPSTTPLPPPPIQYGCTFMSNPPNEAVHRIAVRIQQICPSVVDLLEESHQHLPWIIGKGDLGSIKSMARRTRTDQEIEDEKWAYENHQEMESSGEDEEDEDDEKKSTVSTWTFCGQSYVSTFNIGHLMPSVIGVGVLMR